MELFTDVTAQYRDFATYAAESPCFARWATAVADDAELLAWLDALPSIKQQPNLVFAAARWHGVPAPGQYAALRAALLGDTGAIRSTIMVRSTQTNEVGRLATLTPVLCQLSQASRRPLALVEVGASAGLCLYPDRYDYDWRPRGRLSGSGRPALPCDVDGAMPMPAGHPTVSWRAGIDLSPLDVHDDDAMAWLATLVWPEQDARRERLVAAIEIARTDPPHLARGDLLELLPEQVEAAAEHGEVVVFHSAVIAYLEPSDRERFQQTMHRLVADGACHWLSNEGKGVLPDVTATGPEIPAERATFVLGLDGRAIAWTHGHGATMTWL